MVKVNKFLVSAVFAVLLSVTTTACTTLSSSEASGSITNYSSEEINGNNSSTDWYQSTGEDITFNIHTGNSIGLDGQSLPDVLDEVRPSVVEVTASLDGAVSKGSGVIFDIKDVDDNGINDYFAVITCHHVIDGANSVSITTVDGDEYEAYLIGTDPDSDIGIMCIKSLNDSNLNNLNYATWYKDSDSLRVGTSVVAIGNPLGTLGGTVTSGIVSAMDRAVDVEGKNMHLLQTDCAINGGNSGGGLFNYDGVLVGMVNAGYESADAQGLNFAIPSNKLNDIGSQLLETYTENSKGYVGGKAKLGVTLSVGYYTTNSGIFGNYTREYCIYIESLDRYGSLYRGGLRTSDILKSIKYGDKEMKIISVGTESAIKVQEFLDDLDVQVGGVIEIEYMRISTNNNKTTYKTNTVKIDIVQYVYGQYNK